MSNEICDEVLPALSQSFLEFEGVSVDFLELGVDAILKNDLLKDIPVVGLFTSILKVSYNLHERNLSKKMLVFFKTLNDGSISREKLVEYQKTLSKNPKKLEKELGRVMLFLNRHTEYTQSQVLAKFYQAYIAQRISWEQFCELTVANERMFPNDYAILRGINKERKIRRDTSYDDSYQSDRLVSLGLVSKTSNANVRNIGEAMRWESELSAVSVIIDTTPFGKLFCELL
ncbi:MAG: hypothetical protein FWD84_00065 [Oscillospiraceae bacterium]|nr:hypothetical protein [Oscillospiraceae bacterium]